jgi:hypothetical protein
MRNVVLSIFLSFKDIRESDGNKSKLYSQKIDGRLI